MTDQDDIDALAGEYVVGTLRLSERQALDARRLRDPNLARAIEAWERRLSPILTSVAPVAPPTELFGRIEADIARRGPGGAKAPAPLMNVVTLQRSVTRWRWATAATTALAASLGLFAVFRDALLPPQPQSFVAAFVKNDDLPQFMLTIDLASRELTIRPVGAEKLQGRTYQLWIASDRLGPSPQSLGVLDDGSTPLQRKSLSTYDPNLLQTATFGVSIEQAGGSASGRPSPGALHAKLVPAKP